MIEKLETPVFFVIDPLGRPQLRPMEQILVLQAVVAKLNEVIEAVNRLEERPVFTNPATPRSKNKVSVMKPL